MSKSIKRAYAQMKNNKSLELINSSLDMHFKEVNCNEWSKAKREEYLAIYPEFRLPTDEEKAIEYQAYLDSLGDGEIATQESEYEYSMRKIEYEYCSWVEPIAEQGHIDDSGNYVVDVVAVDGYYTPGNCTPTYEQWLNGETCPEYDTTLDVENFKSTDEEYKKYYDREVLVKLESIIVTTSLGNRLYAGKTSRSDISDVIDILMENGLTEYLWKTSDGIKIITLDEFREARTLGLVEKGRILGVN